MSKDLPQPQQSEEVDLGQLFKIIGNAFDRFFKFIGGIFNKLFLAFVWFVFFVKKHIIKLAIAGVLGLGYGFFKQIKGEPIFKSTSVVKQNYNTGENLYRAISYYNELIAEKDLSTLAKVLDIDLTKVTAIKEFEVEPVVTENEKLKSFDNYIKTLDSTIASTITFEKYQENVKDFQHANQRIIIKATEKNVFEEVVSTIVSKIEDTEYFVTEQQKDLDELTNLENSLKESLSASKDLQDVYKRVLEAPIDNKTGSQTSISIDNTEDKSKTKEFELYTNDINLRRELVSIQRQKEEKQFIIEIVSTQENQGTIDNSKSLFNIALDVKIYYAFILIMATLMVLLVINFIKFLETYKEKI